MNRQEHLLTIMAEECAEVAQRISKALRFGLAEIEPGQALTNAQRIREELHDLEAVIGMLEDEGAIPHEFSVAKQIKKVVKVQKFLEYSAECGTLENSPSTHTLKSSSTKEK